MEVFADVYEPFYESHDSYNVDKDYENYMNQNKGFQLEAELPF
jgi:hypothetical protein